MGTNGRSLSIDAAIPFARMDEIDGASPAPKLEAGGGGGTAYGGLGKHSHVLRTSVGMPIDVQPQCGGPRLPSRVAQIS